MKKTLLTGLSVFIYSLSLHAGKADITNVEVDCNQELRCDFDVTVKHADAGWKHYANRWEVLSTEGEILATRTLAHPHDNEQPFTRSLRAVPLPQGTKTVIIRAHDLVHGFGGETITIDIDSQR